MKKTLSPRRAAQTLDFATLDQIHVQNMTFREFTAISDVLEDCNQHSENTVFLALRYGAEADIDEARAILSGHWKARELTPDLSRRRHALLTKLSCITTETTREKTIPAAVETVIIPRHLFEKMAVAMFGLAGTSSGWTMPDGGPETYAKIWKEALTHLQP